MDARATVELAQRLAAAGVPLESPESNELGSILIRHPGGIFAVDVASNSDAHKPVVARIIGGVPTVRLPADMVYAPDDRAVDMTFVALLSMVAPAVAAEFVKALEDLNVITESRWRRFGTASPRVITPFPLKWNDVRNALCGRPLRALATIHRRLAYERKMFWKQLRSERYSREFEDGFAA